MPVVRHLATARQIFLAHSLGPLSLQAWASRHVLIDPKTASMA